MPVAIAVILGTVFLWELLGGLGLIGWGLIELVRQVLGGPR